MSDFYKIIRKKSEGFYREKGSRFISYAIPIENSEQVKEIIEEFRKEFHDARHVCYAYMLGIERDESRYNDDGEPSGTAGRPILGQINSFELTNILIVVIRYFGGILLGTGGLITAYKEAAADAIRNAEIVEKQIELALDIHFAYELMPEVQRLIKEFDLTISKQVFEMACDMQFSIPRGRYDEIRGRFEKIYGVEIVEVDG